MYACTQSENLGRDKFRGGKSRPSTRPPRTGVYSRTNGIEEAMRHPPHLRAFRAANAPVSLAELCILSLTVSCTPNVDPAAGHHRTYPIAESTTAVTTPGFRPDGTNGALKTMTIIGEIDERRSANVGVGDVPGQSGRAANVVPGQASVRGSLSPEIIGRIIRRHINELMYCYQIGLAKEAGLSGRVSVQITIAATGEVVASAVQSSTMNNIRMENCVVQVIRHWEFPIPSDRRTVSVTYPFDFSTRGRTPL